MLMGTIRKLLCPKGFPPAAGLLPGHWGPARKRGTSATSWARGLASRNCAKIFTH